MCGINQTESRRRVSGHFTTFRPLGDAAVDPMIKKLGQDTLLVNKSAIYRSLGNIGDANSWDILVQALKSETWYHVTQALASLVSIDPVEALPYVYKALENDPSTGQTKSSISNTAGSGC